VGRIGDWQGATITAVTAWSPDLSAVKKSFQSFRGRGYRVVLWLGASQIHAINRLTPGDRLAVEFANQRAEARGERLVYLQVSSPNANFHDLLAMDLALKQAGLKPDWLAVAVVYDDLSDTEVQDNSLALLGPLSEDLVRLGGQGVKDLQQEQQKLREAKAKGEEKTPVERNATAGTPQERLEAFLTRGLERWWPGFQYRNLLQAKLLVMGDALIAGFRGGIEGRRAPAITGEMESYNLAALDSLVRIARADGGRVFLYQQPHRPGEKVFYHDRKAYDAFFVSLQKRYAGQGVYYADLETLVPPEYWGLTNSGKHDVFHFTVAGHERLGRAVDDFLTRAEKGQVHALQ
jgi:hypothetical protein